MIIVSTTSEAECQDALEAFLLYLGGLTDYRIYLRGHLIHERINGHRQTRSAGHRRGTALPDPGPPHPANRS